MNQWQELKAIKHKSRTVVYKLLNRCVVENFSVWFQNSKHLRVVRERTQRMLGLNQAALQSRVLADWSECAKQHKALVQGFATGDLDGDAFAVQMFDKAGMEMMITQSYSENFGLDGERCGAAARASTTHLQNPGHLRSLAD